MDTPATGPFAVSAPGHYSAELGYQATLEEAALGQFGILAPTPVPVPVPVSVSVSVPVLVPEEQRGVFALPEGQAVERTPGQLSSRIVVDPPELGEWRERLFNVDEMIVLTHEQFETYFPHIDNVYSHRSTQRYKRKPFISHYWDCRMKGRPPGTPKSSDPAKKKRKRSARERDLCDVKIKITEYFPDATALPLDEAAAAPGVAGALGAGQRIWTIQRVNGNGGNGKGDGVAGPHKHGLEKSDEIKKNSVQRFLAKHEKEARRLQRPVVRKATGMALTTVRKHSKENELKLYGACFCPFSQRVWIALEAKGLAYQYCETDPCKKPPMQGLETTPREVVPLLKHGDWTCSESAIILEYLEDVDQETPLYPPDARLKADCRRWIHHINTHIVPAFFTVLRKPSAAATADLQTALQPLIQAASPTGPFFCGPGMCLVDVHLAPFALRLVRVLKPLRAWPDPEPGSRWRRWVDALEACECVRVTTSADELYVETAEILALEGEASENRGPGGDTVCVD